MAAAVTIANNGFAAGAEHGVTVMGSGFAPGDVIFGELTVGGEAIPVVGGTANDSGAFSATGGLDLERLTAITPGVYTLYVRDTNDNNATAPLLVCPADGCPK